MTETPDPDAEWALARQAFEWPHYHALLQTVDKRALAAGYARSGLGWGEIAIQNGKWRRMFRGEAAIIVPARSPAGDLLDLVAFRMETPKSFWPMSGSAMGLGADNMDRAAFMGEALLLHETPLDWLRAGCEGSCILDWTRYWPLWLAGIPNLKFDDDDFRRRAMARFARPLPVPAPLVKAA